MTTIRVDSVTKSMIIFRVDIMTKLKESHLNWDGIGTEKSALFLP